MVTVSVFSSGAQLHRIDLTNPATPLDEAVSTGFSAWGALLGASGDAVVVSSGWSSATQDVYRLGSGAPGYVGTIRATYPSDPVVRVGGTLFVPAGIWGVQVVPAP